MAFHSIYPSRCVQTLQGNIDNCLFSKNTAATSGTSVFRTESSGSLDGNQGIDTSSDSTSVVIESQADYA